MNYNVISQMSSLVLIWMNKQILIKTILFDFMYSLWELERNGGWQFEQFDYNGLERL